MNLNPLRPVEPAVQAMRGADSRGAGGCYGMSNEELIAEARRRHIENPLEAAWCEGCDTSFPCDALILADALEAAERERDEFADALEAADRERDEAVADNAALLEALNDAVAEYADTTRFDKHGDEAEIARLRGIAEADHPGAVLLARIERLEAVLQSTRGLLNEMHLPTQGCTAEACTMRTDFCCVRQSVIDALSESEAARP